MNAATPILSVVLPTFNERDNLAPLIERLSAALQKIPHELLVMDDRSPDGTAAVARELGARYPALKVIERQPPQGLTDSIREGVERASGEFVVWMDCDLSHPPEMVIDLLAPLQAGEADITALSRYVHGAADIRASRFERLYSRAINKLAQICIHPAVTDYTTGYVMGERERILDLGFVGNYGEYCIELLGRAALRGYRVRELPYEMASRVAGESKTAPSLRHFVTRGWRYLGTVVRLVGLRITGSEARRASAGRRT